MAPPNKVKETIPFNFEEIYNGIAEKFAQKGYDSPYDGSNLAQLITAMAYTTSMLNANTAVNINEMILSLARKRDNIIQDARLLGYESAKKISYIYELTLKFNKEQLYTIPKYSVFTANSKNYYYIGEDLEINAIVGQTLKIRVKEGILHKYDDEPEILTQVVGGLQYFDIPYKNVEDDGIEVFVTNYSPEGILLKRERYKKSETLLIDKDANLRKKFIRIEDDELETPRIYFVLSGVGNPIPMGSIIEFNILQSSGEDGKMYEIPKSPIEDIDILDYTLKIKGTNEESNESIKQNAPVLHNTATRVVTANDYEVVCKKHPACKEAFVFGGEDEHPKKLGNLFFSLTPEKAERTFTSDPENTHYQLEKLNDIFNNYLLDDDYISKTTDSEGFITNIGVIDSLRLLNLPALEYNIRNPIYILMNFDIAIVKYPLSSIKKDVRAKLFNVLNKYIEKLEIFESEFFESNVIKHLDEYLTDVTGLELDVNFKIMLDEKSISSEDIPQVCVNPEASSAPFLKNPAFEKKKYDAIHLYLETPYELLYDDFGNLIYSHIPSIDTNNFIYRSSPVYIDSYSYYDRLFIDYSTFERDNEIYKSDALVPIIKFDIKYRDLNGQKKIVGAYYIYNDRKIKIKAEIFCIDDSYTKRIYQSSKSDAIFYKDDGFLDLEELPKIKDNPEINSTFDNNYEIVPDSYTKLDDYPDIQREKISIDIKDQYNRIVGTYNIFNDRDDVYIVVKMHYENTQQIPEYQEFLSNNPDAVNLVPFGNSTFKKAKYLDLKYPSKNFKTVNRCIFKLNSVNIFNEMPRKDMEFGGPVGGPVGGPKQG